MRDASNGRIAYCTTTDRPIPKKEKCEYGRPLNSPLSFQFSNLLHSHESKIRVAGRSANLWIADNAVVVAVVTA